MAYPIELLDPTATEDQVKQALLETVQQLVSEGLSEEEALAQAQQMFQQLSGQPMANNRTTTNMTSGEFIRGGTLTGASGASNSFQTVPNPRLNNINPASYPRGSI